MTDNLAQLERDAEQLRQQVGRVAASDNVHVQVACHSQAELRRLYERIAELRQRGAEAEGDA